MQFWRRRFLKEMHFLAQFGTLCALVVHIFVGTNPSSMCAKIKFVDVVVFEK
jgi:hypothetical protein